MTSLRARLFATLLALLCIGFGLTLAALDYSFRTLAERARRDVLEANVVALIAAADFDSAGRLAPPGDLAEPRLNTPGSGLAAQIRARKGAAVWRSRSALGLTVQPDDDVRPGQQRLARLTAADGTRFMALSLGVAWELGRGRSRDYVFTALESLEPYYAQLYRFRARLLAGFGAFASVLLVAVMLSLRYLLEPLRRIEAEIGEIEAGRRERLGAGWPRELDGVAANLNALLRAEHERQQRYRNMLGNLAHSLKTPLSVIRGALDAPAPADPALLASQVERMQDIVRHQLERARLAAPGVGAAALPVRAVLEELAGALGKVHAARALALEVEAEPALTYPIDRGDFLELAGNLGDNACKWARGRVRLSARAWPRDGWRRAGLELVVADDGPGIPAAERERVLGRGVRLDERVAGQGLGLAMVEELVRGAGGEVVLTASEWGGLEAVARLPGA